MELHDAGEADETGAGANRVRLITLTLSPPSQASHNYHCATEATFQSVHLDVRHAGTFIVSCPLLSAIGRPLKQCLSLKLCGRLSISIVCLVQPLSFQRGLSMG